MLVCILRQMKHTLAQLISEFGLLGLLCSSSAGLAAGDAGSVAVDSRVNSPIAWCDLGAKATAQYSGDGLAITTAQDGTVRLRCVFQKLDGEVTCGGLWLSSTACDAAPAPASPFRLVAAAFGREGDSLATLPQRGAVSATSTQARFARPGLSEEYFVSVDGVRQDFVVAQSPAGPGDLCVELTLTGARAETAAGGARLVLDGSGRKLAYSRLCVVDAMGRELAARIEVPAPDRLAVVVADAHAVYPVRIDPTFSDADWSALGLGMNSYVNALAVSDTYLYAGGSFSTANGSSANGIAKWDGTSWSALGTGMNGTVYALAVAGANLYAGGLFTKADEKDANYIAKWDGTSWSALGAGMNSSVYALAVAGPNLYAGGLFIIGEGNHVARWDGTSWSALGAGVNNAVWALAVSGTSLYAGGTFTTEGGAVANRIAKWDGTSWSALGSGMNDTVRALAVSGTDLYAGGLFTTADGNSANYIAKWNGAAWSALGSGVNSTVFALAVSGTSLYAGGFFNYATNGTSTAVSANYIASWNGTAWSALGSGMNDTVYALALSDTNLYAGGLFTTAGGKSATYAAYAHIPAATTTTVVSDSNPSLPSANVKFTATISAVSPSTTVLTGTVQFKTNGNNLSTPVTVNGSGVATLTVLGSVIGHGSKTITAEYANSDGNFNGSTGTLSPNQVVDTPPVAGAHYLGSVLNTELTISASALAALDYDADADPLSITAVSGTSTNGPSGNVTLSGGNVHYTPATGFVGVDQFTYTISDGFTGGTATSTANVTVRLAPATSVFNYISASPGTVNLRGHGIPGRSYDIQWSANANFSTVGGVLASVTAAANGIITYTDNAGADTRYYRFVVRVDK